MRDDPMSCLDANGGFCLRQKDAILRDCRVNPPPFTPEFPVHGHRH